MYMKAIEGKAETNGENDDEEVDEPLMMKTWRMSLRTKMTKMKRTNMTT